MTVESVSSSSLLAYSVARSRSARSFVSCSLAFSASAQSVEILRVFRAFATALIELLRLPVAFRRRFAAGPRAAVRAASKRLQACACRLPIDVGSDWSAHAAGASRRHEHVTLSKPDTGVETHPCPATQVSTVHGSPSSHADGPATSQRASGGSVVVVVGPCPGPPPACARQSTDPLAPSLVTRPVAPVVTSSHHTLAASALSWRVYSTKRPSGDQVKSSM